MNELLGNWEKVTWELGNYFVERYFGDDASDVYWIGNDIGDVLAINDYFFSLDFIREAIKYNATTKQLFDFYDLKLEFDTKNKPMEINFRNFIKKDEI